MPITCPRIRLSEHSARRWCARNAVTSVPKLAHPRAQKATFCDAHHVASVGDTLGSKSLLSFDGRGAAVQIRFSRRCGAPMRWFDRMKLFPDKSHPASFAWSQHRNRGLDEATKAGIGGRLQHAFVGYSILGDAHAANQHRIAQIGAK